MSKQLRCMYLHDATFRMWIWTSHFDNHSKTLCTVNNHANTQKLNRIVLSSFLEAYKKWKLRLMTSQITHRNCRHPIHHGAVIFVNIAQCLTQFMALLYYKARQTTFSIMPLSLATPSWFCRGVVPTLGGMEHDFASIPYSACPHADVTDAKLSLPGVMNWGVIWEFIFWSIESNLWPDLRQRVALRIMLMYAIIGALVVHRANLGYYIIDMFGLSPEFEAKTLSPTKVFETSSSQKKYGVHGTYSET